MTTTEPSELAKRIAVAVLNSPHLAYLAMQFAETVEQGEEGWAEKAIKIKTEMGTSLSLHIQMIIDEEKRLDEVRNRPLSYLLERNFRL